ncbi:MAG: glycoside hydrolase family 3 N-terminal domain-containing protein [Eubacteriales bacterium]|nr:glycoside hydrolase family 3 N-terminal domain-containing protein [Eubacteriales bacterium]
MENMGRIYKNPLCTPESRAEDLLSQMTLKEKIAQMRLFKSVNKDFNGDSFTTKYPYGVGGTYDTDDLNAASINKMQQYMLEKTRLGIPLLMMGESIHGFKCDGATVFPQAIGLGATFDRNLIHDIADTIGTEMRAMGVFVTYAPNLDISRDPRWGRTEENYGEDPYLTSRLGTEYIKALQSHGVAACPKHYVAHGTPENGINMAPVHAGERELREVMLVPFEAAFIEGGAMCVMPAYSELDGVPVHASRFLLTDLLRNEIGFDGFSISDYGALRLLVTMHHIAKNNLEAGMKALKAGVDMEAPTNCGFGEDFEKAASQGIVDIALIDTAVRRILLCKFRLGLFENPYADDNPKKSMHKAKSAILAYKAACESIVLLKNEKSLLPLNKAEIKSIALIGPSAAFPQLGDYTARSAYEKAVTLYKALADKIGGNVRINFAQGCSFGAGSDEEIEYAADAAASSDVAVLALGDNSCFHGGVGWGDEGTKGTVTVTCGEGFDVGSLDLPGRQQELLEKVYSTGTPVILILITGRPYAITWAQDNIPAIIQAWYPGEQGGNALTDILFGYTEPSGRLPISFPRSVGNLPCYYNYKVSARGYHRKRGTREIPGRDYVFDTPEPLYEFGYGLSYTKFEYSNLVVESIFVGDMAVPINGISASDSALASSVLIPKGTKIQVHISVTLKNVGLCKGSDVVMLFISDLVCSITPFVRALRGFERVTLMPGKMKKVLFVLGWDDFSFIDGNMKRSVEAGEFKVTIKNLSTTLTL